MAVLMNQNAVFYRFVNSLLRIMLAGALFLLLLHSLFSTGFLGKIVLEDGTLQERTLNIADTPSRHFFLFVLCSASFFLARRLWQTIKERDPFRWTQKRDDMVFWGLLLFTFAVGNIYVLLTQLAPGSDPAKVWAVAMQWRQGDFSAFEEGGYLFSIPFSIGHHPLFLPFKFCFRGRELCGGSTGKRILPGRHIRPAGKADRLLLASEGTAQSGIYRPADLVAVSLLCDLSLRYFTGNGAVFGSGLVCVTLFFKEALPIHSDFLTLHGGSYGT